MGVRGSEKHKAILIEIILDKVIFKGTDLFLYGFTVLADPKLSVVSFSQIMTHLELELLYNFIVFIRITELTKYLE
jgi:hypothetical protein